MTKKYLIIQTASLGDVILSSSLVESIHAYSSEIVIDILIKKEYFILFENHPYLNNVFLLDRKSNKIIEMIRLLKLIRNMNYDAVFCVQRFFTAGLLASFSKSKIRSGFKKSPFSFLFTHAFQHHLNGIHETERNHVLLSCVGITKLASPKLYCTEEQITAVKKYQNASYITIAPASLWHTKQFPIEKWIEFINEVPEFINVYIIGSKEDTVLGKKILLNLTRKNCYNICGEFNIMETAAFMKGATMNFMNDSAPLHLASAIDAPATAVFCSTVPAFGFGPLGANNTIVETDLQLDCRPCGIHGKKKCPKQHFKCAYTIDIQNLIYRITF